MLWQKTVMFIFLCLFFKYNLCQNHENWTTSNTWDSSLKTCTQAWIDVLLPSTWYRSLSKMDLKLGGPLSILLQHLTCCDNSPELNEMVSTWHPQLSMDFKRYLQSPLCFPQPLLDHWKCSNIVGPCLPPLLADFMNGTNHSLTNSAWQSTRTLQVIVILTEKYRSITPCYTIKLYILPAVELHLALEVPYAKALDRIVCDCEMCPCWVFKSSLVFFKSLHLIIHDTAGRSNKILLFVLLFYNLASRPH